MTSVLEQTRERIQAEGGGWVTLRREAPEATDRSPGELLELARSLPGNLRYVRVASGVELLGEVRSVGGSATFDESRRRLEDWLNGNLSKGDVTDESLEAALEGIGVTWARREQGWAVPASANIPREITLGPEPGGVRLESVLADWDAIEDVSRSALAVFLLAAQAQLRGVRFHLEACRVVASVGADAAHLETDVLNGVRAIATGCRLLSREAAALLLPTLARHYLACREMQATSPR